MAWCQAMGPALNSTKLGTTEKRERQEGMEDVNTLPLYLVSIQKITPVYQRTLHEKTDHTLNMKEKQIFSN